jgi:hypothetical protein
MEDGARYVTMLWRAMMDEALHPDAERFLQAIAASGRPSNAAPTPAETCAAAKAGNGALCLPGPEMAKVGDFFIPAAPVDLPVRLYTPFAAARYWFFPRRRVRELRYRHA